MFGPSLSGVRGGHLGVRYKPVAKGLGEKLSGA